MHLPSLLTAPTIEPVTLAEAKDHLRLDPAVGLDDAYVTTLITVARQYVEQVCWRGLLTQAWEITLPSFYGGRHRYDIYPPRHHFYDLVTHEDHIKLRQGKLAPLADLLLIDPPLSPVPTSPVISVKYLDTNGAEQTLATTEYEVELTSAPGKLRLAYGKSWPATRDTWNAVKVVYWVGSALANVPLPLKQAILLLISQLYEHRTPEVVARAILPIQFSFDALVAPYSLAEVG